MAFAWGAFFFIAVLLRIFLLVLLLRRRRRLRLRELRHVGRALRVRGRVDLAVEDVVRGGREAKTSEQDGVSPLGCVVGLIMLPGLSAVARTRRPLGRSTPQACGHACSGGCCREGEGDAALCPLTRRCPCALPGTCSCRSSRRWR